jgi:hypothetical protein
LEQNSVHEDAIIRTPPIALAGYNLRHVETCILTTAEYLMDVFNADVY